MKWAQLLSGRFFFFFCFPSIFIAKKRKGTCYHFIYDVCVRVCAEAGLKNSFFFFAPKLLSLGARLRPRWKKMRPEKWHPGSAQKILRLAQKRFFEPCVDSPAPGKMVKHFKDWEIKHIPAALSTSQRNVEERANAANAPATSASLAPHTLAMSCHGYDRPKPKKCRKQLNGHLSSQTTIANRLESTFPPHLCKKIKFVPDSRQPFQNGRILNLAEGLKTLKLAKSFALFLAKNLHHSFSPLKWR